MTDFVIKPLVLVPDETGAIQYLYQGSVVPSYVGADRRKVLRDEGYIAAEGAAVPVASPSQPADDAKPAKSGSKADWKAYALSQGMSEEEAEAATRDDLAAKYS